VDLNDDDAVSVSSILFGMGKSWKSLMRYLSLLTAWHVLRGRVVEPVLNSLVQTGRGLTQILNSTLGE